MTLTQLRHLVAIADASFNITLAAERTHATQSGVSKQLKQLEDELGFLLFARRGRILEAATPAGERVIAHARRILAETANIRTYAANARGDAGGRLVLATTHTQARYVLPAAIAMLKRSFPEVGVDLQPAPEGEVVERLARGDADCAIVSTAGEAPADGIAVPLYRWRRKVLVPRSHPFARLQRAPTLAELAREPLVSYTSSARPDSSLRRSFEAAGLQPTLAMTARDADLIKTYVRAGLGVGVLAEMAVSASADADLAALDAPDFPECIAWALLPRERVLRDYAIALLTALAPQVDGHDVRRVVEGNAAPAWAAPPEWTALAQAITQ